MNKVALIIIYNHQYNKNIKILEDLYGNRFSNIYHLVPFYNGEKSNVIPVYENSFYFQGYVAQGFKIFFKEDYIHYFFIADDLLLNPIINEKNYKLHLRLNENACFLPGYIPLYKRKIWWARVGEAYRYNIRVLGAEAENQLPNYNIALKAFKKFGLEIKPLSFHQIWKRPTSFKQIVSKILREKSYITKYIKNMFVKKQYNLSYPIVGSYSDIFVISSDTIKQFCHYCGVFAVTRLHVEVGLPTALVLSAKEIVTEKDLKLQGKTLWTIEDFKILSKYEYQLNKLLEDFPSNYLYLHQIKLSAWNVE